MSKEFEKPLLEAKESVKKVQVLLDMLENINMRKLNFIFNEHVEKHSLPVNVFHIEDLHYEFGERGYHHGDDDPNSRTYMGVIEYLYQLVYVIAVHNKEMPAMDSNKETSTIRKITDGKTKVTSKESVLSDYERGVLEPELDEDGNFLFETGEQFHTENFNFTGEGRLVHRNRWDEYECISYKNTYRLYLSMKRFFEGENNE